MKAHHAINKLIASASLHSYQKGGEVKKEPDFDYQGTLPLTLEEFPMVEYANVVTRTDFPHVFSERSFVG